MKKIIMIIGICLCMNLYAEDLDELYEGVWLLNIEDLNILTDGHIDSSEEGVNAIGSIYSITSMGKITADDNGIDAFNMEGDITIDSSGTIRAILHGISANLMQGDIYNYGIIESNTTYGIYAVGMIGSIYTDGSNGNGEIGSNGNQFGINAYEMIGNITNVSDGYIYSSGGAGIYAQGMLGDIINISSAIYGKSTAIYATGMIGDILISGNSEIDGSIGIDAGQMEGSISIGVDSWIMGNRDAIYAFNMIGSITNLGTISADGNGINAGSMTGNIFNHGEISGVYSGIYAYGMQGDITNGLYATIEANGDSSIGIYAEGMTGNITNHASINGTESGIYSSYIIGNIENFGKIGVDADGSGIYAWGMRGNITNYLDATIGARNASSSDSSKVGIDARYMEGNIINYGLIEGYSYGINAESMKGYIENHGTIDSFIAIDASSGEDSSTVDIINTGTISGNKYAINAFEMGGSIYNEGTIVAADQESATAIRASYMTGDIINYNGANITGALVAIDANYMDGDIINDGTIKSLNKSAIQSNFMLGEIVNCGLISSTYGNAISGSGMQGDIINHYMGRLESTYSYALDFDNFTGTLYNYGYIGEEFEGSGSIVSNGNLSLVGNGIIKGEIKSLDEDWLNITNDMDTVLDLSNAPLVGWSTINLLGGEMIITEVDSGEGITYINQGGNANVHLSIQDTSVQYTLDSGTLNPYYESSPFGYFSVNNFYAYSSNSTIEIDFGYDVEEDGHAIDFIQANSNGIVSPGVTIKFIPQTIFEAGWEYTYKVFNGITVTPEVVLESSLFYEVEQVPGLYPTRVLAVSDDFDLSDDFWVVISRNNDTFADHANYYNQGIAKALDPTEKVREPVYLLMLALEQATTADELNNLLEPYNMVGYASLANNNINWINNRAGNLFGILGGSVGTGTEVVSNTVGSSYATDNSAISRDINGNNVWVELYMSDTTLDGKDNYEIDSDGYEVAFGMDKQINSNMILGLSFNISDFESDITGGLPVSVETDGFGINAYGQYSQGQINHKAIIGYAGYENESKRLGNKADFDSNEFFIAYRLEYTIEKKSFNIIPLAGLQYSHITYDDIIEDGGNSGLEGYDYDSLQSELRVKLVKQLNALRLDAGLSWLHELMDTESNAAAVSDFGSYAQNSIERDEDTFRLSLGLDYQISKKVNIGLDYAKEFGDNTDSDSINAKISFSF